MTGLIREQIPREHTGLSTSDIETAERLFHEHIRRLETEAEIAIMDELVKIVKEENEND